MTIPFIAMLLTLLCKVFVVAVEAYRRDRARRIEVQLGVTLEIRKYFETPEIPETLKLVKL